MTRAEWERKKKEELNKPQVHKKISNNFIDNTLGKSTTSALKITYYLSTILKELDYKKELNTITLNTKDMLSYTELTMTDIKNNLKKMQETNITFINEEEKWEEYIALIPRIKFHYGRNKKVEIDIYSKIAKLILEVVDNYTFIDTKELMRLKNKHSIRLLPLLKKISSQDKNMKQKTFKSISELNEFFGVNYKRYIDIENYILKKAKAELDNNSSLTFDYEMNFEKIGKTKSRIVSITIKPKSKNNYQSTIFSNFEDTSEPKAPVQTKSKKEKERIEAPTQEYITKKPTSQALDYGESINLTPNQIMTKFREFQEWELNVGKKRSFLTFLKIGYKNNWDF